jgi:hypothetical protein
MPLPTSAWSVAIRAAEHTQTAQTAHDHVKSRPSWGGSYHSPPVDTARVAPRREPVLLGPDTARRPAAPQVPRRLAEGCHRIGTRMSTLDRRSSLL